MIKVMLVDDEYYFRQALKASIPWEENGFTVCGEARDGEEALDKLAALAPDIALVDINMPVLDGLAFARIVRERELPMKIVILSGHSEFEYARQAVQLGVSNYLLKPVDDAALIETLLDLRQQMEREQGLQIEMDQLKQQVRENRPLLKAKLLHELLLGQTSMKPELLIQRMSYLEVPLFGADLQIAVIEPDAENTASWDYEERQLWNFAIANLAGEILGDAVAHEICFDDEDRVCILVAYGDSGMRQAGPALLADRLEQLRDCIQRLIRVFTVSIGIGDVKHALEEMPASYREALLALKSRIATGANRVIPFNTLGEANPKMHLLTSSSRTKLLMHLRTVNREDALEMVSVAFQKVRGEQVSPELLPVFCMDLASLCLELLTDMGLAMRDVFQDAPMALVEQVQAFRTLREMELWAMQTLTLTMDAVAARRHSKADTLVRDIKGFIAEHYGDEDLGIDSLAKNLYVHYSHLCLVFKRETGSTLNEYMTECRMEKAKELFDGGNRSVSDVAIRVGYPDANYFGKLFKKHYGTTPSRYVETRTEPLRRNP